MVKRSAATVALGVMFALYAAGARAGDLEVTVAVADGKSIASGVLIAEDQSLPLSGGGKVMMKGLPDKRIAVTVDAIVGENPGVRYLGVADVKALKGMTVPVKVTIAPVADIEAFCSGCHPYKDQPLKPGQIVRDLHVSGIEMPQRYLPQVEKRNAAAAQLRKDKDKVKNPWLPIILEKRMVKVDGKDLVRLFCTCESCHTTHLNTPWAKKLRAPIRESSELCEGCHN